MILLVQAGFMKTLRGLHVPLITPFTADGKLAEQALGELAHTTLADGADGLVALGTTAEAATLDETEKRLVVEICAQACREHTAELIVGAGTNDTRQSLTALQALAEWPETTAALVPVPYFTRPSEAGVVAHFAELAAGSPVPLIVYNIPHRTGQLVGVDALRALAAIPGVAGVKQAVGGIDGDTVALVSDPPADFAVLCGEDVFYSALLALGAAGGILAAAQLCPRHFIDLASAWQAGDVAKARELGARLTPLAEAVFAEPNPSVIKGVLHELGRIPTADVRLPMLPAGPDSVATALNLLRALDN
jgi:4-hydroxy-tetrahydrodipicolinate synthase